MINSFDILDQKRLAESFVIADEIYSYCEYKGLLEAVKNRGRKWEIISLEDFGNERSAKWCKDCFNHFIQIDLLDDSKWKLKSEKKKIQIKQIDMKDSNKFIKVVFQTNKGFKYQWVSSISLNCPKKINDSVEKECEELNSFYIIQKPVINNLIENSPKVVDLENSIYQQEKPFKRIKVVNESIQEIVRPSIKKDNKTESYHLIDSSLNQNSNSVYQSNYEFRGWTQEQNDILRKAVGKYENYKKINWKQISINHFQNTKSENDCKNHFLNVLDPNLNHSPYWTKEEDEKLKEAVEKYKKNNQICWTEICEKVMKNRSKISCKTRYQRHLSFDPASTN